MRRPIVWGTCLFVVLAAFAGWASGRVSRDTFRIVATEPVTTSRDYYSLHQAGDLPTIPDYNTGIKWARADGRPLVTFVGRDAITIPGCIVCRDDTIGLPDGVRVSWWVGDAHVGDPVEPNPGAIRKQLEFRGVVVPAELQAVPLPAGNVFVGTPVVPSAGCFGGTCGIRSR